MSSQDTARGPAGGVAQRGAQDAAEYDVAVVGAGFAGMYQIIRLRELGVSFRVFEAGDDVGGTWYWNRYPGARCDVPSLEYSYSFSPELEQEWEWSEKYATQPEILAYASHVADRFGLRRDIEFGTRVVSTVWDENEARWTLTTDGGKRVRARFVITAVGALSAPKTPDIPGFGAFAGPTLFTSSWPEEGFDFTGLRVGVIGTGSSAIQSIPIIAGQARSLTVFQRTAAYTLPAQNRKLDPDYVTEYKATYREKREQVKNSRLGLLVTRAPESALDVDDEERRRRYQECWDAGLFGCTAASFRDITTDPRANETAAEFIREKIREIVADPQVAEDLSPRGYPFGTKRVCLDTGYYETYNQDHVTLVDLRRDPIVEITPDGVRTASAAHEFDVLVIALGFDAITGAISRLGIVGRDGVRLEDEWRRSPRSYLGLAVSGFPNLFTITGPGSPSIVSNVLVSIEQAVDWITLAIEHLDREGVRIIDADPEAEAEWVRHVADIAATTLYLEADSYFVGANVPGKPRVFMPYFGGVNTYREVCEAVATDGFRGFALEREGAGVVA